MTGNPLQFPKGFYWGCATSAHQVEGSNTNNDWWQAEQKGTVRYKSGRACDSYNRYEEDFDLAQAMHNNAHRFSIEWSRIEPEEGKFSEEAIEHYRKVIRALKARGMEPFVTLHHFTNPIWFAQKGGWLHKDAAEYFARYAEYVATQLKDDVRYWITINEPNVYAGDGFLTGKFPPHRRNMFAGWQVRARMLDAHCKAAERLRRIKREFHIGIAYNVSSFEAAGKGPVRLANIFFVWCLQYVGTGAPLKKIAPYTDFIGINYYRHFLITFGRLEEKGAGRSDSGWALYPPGIYNVVMEVKKYGKPIFITENGLADAHDAQRPAFIREHLQWLHKAIEEGADVRGYFHWSLLDNFEWAEGFSKRFGLVEVNFDTMERRMRESGRVYGEICKNNGLS